MYKVLTQIIQILIILLPEQKIQFQIHNNQIKKDRTVIWWIVEIIYPIRMMSKILIIGDQNYIHFKEWFFIIYVIYAVYYMYH